MVVERGRFRVIVIVYLFIYLLLEKLYIWEKYSMLIEDIGYGRFVEI